MLRYFDNEENPLRIPCPRSPGETKRLLIRVDDQFKPSSYEQPRRIEEDKLRSLLDSVYDVGDGVEHVQPDPESDLPLDLPPEQRETLARQIALFRERAAQRDRELEEQRANALRRRRRNEENEHNNADQTREQLDAIRKSMQDILHDNENTFCGVTYQYAWILNDGRWIHEQDIERRIQEEKEHEYQKVSL
jgi:hypothetical protein